MEPVVPMVSRYKSIQKWNASYLWLAIAIADCVGGGWGGETWANRLRPATGRLVRAARPAGQPEHVDGVRCGPWRARNGLAYSKPYPTQLNAATLDCAGFTH